MALLLLSMLLSVLGTVKVICEIETYGTFVYI